MKKTKLSLAATSLVAALATPLPASANDLLVQPGLWEFTTDMSMSGMPNLNEMMAQMQEHMKNLPPEARDMLNQQLAQQGMAFGANNALQQCITPEEASQSSIFAGPQEGDCTYNNVKISNTRITADIRCEDPEFTGSFETIIHSASHFTSNVEGVSEDGPFTVKTTAKRISDDCGALGKTK